MNTNAKSLETVLKNKYGNNYRKGKSKNGLEFRICCPFCHRTTGKEDKKYKLYLNPDVNKCFCFKCNYKGTVSNLFKDMRFNNDNPFIKERIRTLPDDVNSPGTLYKLSELPEDHIALRYLKGRGFDPVVLEEFYGVKYCGEGYRLSNIFDTSNTIIFPIWMTGKLVGWQSRLLYSPDKLTDSECAALGYQYVDGKYIRPPKYFTSPGLDKGRILFNYDSARKSEVVVVTEGPMDCIASGPCSVATLGKGVSKYQSNLIKTYWKLAITLLDPGDADTQAEQLYNELWTAMPVVKVNLRNYKDPGEASTAEIWSQIYTCAEEKGINLLRYNLGPLMTKRVFKL